jgi:hypothetical protein
MKTDPQAALLALVQRQRRFEWELARDEQARVAGQLVAGRTHDLLNLIQIVELAVFRLQHEGLGNDESLAELTRASQSAATELQAMMDVARPEVVIARGAPVATAVTGIVDALREVATFELHVDVASDTATRCATKDLEHLLIGLVLDAIDQRMALTIRERRIEGKPYVEIVRATAVEPPSDGHELRTVTAIVTRNGGEVATSERRGGGVELIVALPVISS